MKSEPRNLAARLSFSRRALYALKKRAIVRVSVGGPDTEDVKIEKSKKLAHKALKRLG